DDFKCRSSAIIKMMANSRSNPVLTEKQTLRLIELEAKESVTDKQKEEMAELLIKKGNSSKIVLSDMCIEYLMEVYAWETQGMIPVSKESLDILQMQKGKMGEQTAGTM